MQVRESQKKWRKKNAKYIATYGKRWKAQNPEKVRACNRASRLRLRMKVLEHYGSKCTCCGESENHFLTIDHVYGGGTKHRKILKPSQLYGWLIRNNFPPSFQILCYNCNMAKGRYGICPHQSGG